MAVVVTLFYANNTPIEAAAFHNHAGRATHAQKQHHHHNHPVPQSAAHLQQQLLLPRQHRSPRTALFASSKKSKRQRKDETPVVDAMTIIEGEDDDDVPKTKDAEDDSDSVKADAEDVLKAEPSSSSSDDNNNQQEQKKKDPPPLKTYPARFLEDNGIRLDTDAEGRVSAKRAPISRQPQSTTTTNNKKEENETTSEIQPLAAEIISKEAQPLKKPKVVLPPIFKRTKKQETLKEQPAVVVPQSGFNVVLTHCTADFDSLASAVGLAKLWASTLDAEDDGDGGKPVLDNISSDDDGSNVDGEDMEGERAKKDFDSASHVPTFVVLPRGAHPGVQRFLALHKHLFPIRSLRSLPDDLTGLNRLGLVDAQRRDRIGPAANLLQYANRVTVVDHHIDSDTDIPEATDYVVDKVGSVSTMIAERLQQAGLDLTEAEATLLALGIHADTGSLCFDSTTPRDAMSLAWVMSQGASQTAIAEHARSSLSPEQQGVLTQALINTNSKIVHGVTLSSVLLSADGFINGLAAVTADALELSSSDLFLLAVVYEAQSGGKRRSKGKKSNQGERLTSKLLSRIEESQPASIRPSIPQEAHGNLNAGTHNTTAASNSTTTATTASNDNNTTSYTAEEMAQAQMVFEGAGKGGEDAMRRQRLHSAFDRNDLDASGFLEQNEIAAALSASGIIASDESIKELMDAIDTDGDGKVNFEEFVNFAINAENQRQEDENSPGGGAAAPKASTMIIIGRVKAGVNTKGVKLNRLLEKFGGGGHAKAASATVRLNDESEAEGILEDLINEIVDTSLQEQVTVGDFMTAPVLSVKPHMTENQVEDLFTRYDVRALPVVDDANEVIGLVTYKEVAAAKQRMWNKEQKKLRREKEAAEKGETIPYQQDGNSNSDSNKAKEQQRKSGSTVKGWMKQHVRVVEDSTTMAELEAILMESDVGCIPVVQDGTKRLIGMVTRTDLLRQHRYYPTLHYHNKGFADSISARKPIIELRKRLKKFDLESE